MRLKAPPPKSSHRWQGVNSFLRRLPGAAGRRRGAVMPRRGRARPRGLTWVRQPHRPGWKRWTVSDPPPNCGRRCHVMVAASCGMSQRQGAYVCGVAAAAGSRGCVPSRLGGGLPGRCSRRPCIFPVFQWDLYGEGVSPSPTLRSGVGLRHLLKYCFTVAGDHRWWLLSMWGRAAVGVGLRVKILQVAKAYERGSIHHGRIGDHVV